VSGRKRAAVRELVEKVKPEWADGLYVYTEYDCHIHVISYYAIPVKRYGDGYCYMMSWDEFQIKSNIARKLGTVASVILLPDGRILEVKDSMVEGDCIVLLTEDGS
jgi:hypothetical protein